MKQENYMKLELRATNKYHSTPVSKKLASNFIELGYGLQVEGMAAEMFFNRSFEPFYPYRLINKLWYDLLDDENDLSSRCETDWRVFDWYHSSYEHNAWFAFPGTAGYQPVCDDSTFIIEDSQDGNVHISLIPDDHHGSYAMRVINGGADTGGLAQDGKYCFTGVKYNFRGYVRRVKGSGMLSAALYKEGTVKKPVCVKELAEITGEYSAVSAVLEVPEEGRYTFVLIVPANSEVVCDDFSLTPSDAIGGFKKSAVEAGKYVAPKVIRWPGGCFASFYDWKKGVGEKRLPSYSYFWGGYQYNDIGTDELAAYAEAVGGESMICVNMYHPFKRFYDYVPEELLDRDPNDRTLPAALHGRDLMEFTDKAEGARQAALWVEYCNGDASTEGGRMRIKNGREKPYGVRYWEMDNEVHRWFRAEEYAEECVAYSKAMKAVDPSIKIGMISYCYGLDKLRTIVEIAGEYIDFLADRGISEDELEAKLAIINQYNEAHGTNIKYCNTEWLPLNGADVYNMVPRSETRVNKCYMFSKWTYALDAASTLMMWQRHGDAVDFVNFNNLANTHSQSVLETPKEGWYITAPGMMMHMFANTKAYRTLIIDGYHPGRNDAVQVQLSANEKGDALVLDLLNRSEEDGEIDLDLSAFDVIEGRHEGVILKGESLISMNKLNDQQVRENPSEVTVEKKHVKKTVEKLSYAEYIIPLGPCENAVIRPGEALRAFENGLFGVNTEVTRKGFFGGLSAQMINNRKLFAGDGSPSGWECDGAEFVKDRREESLCGSNFVILKNGTMRQGSNVIALKDGAEYEAKVWIRGISEGTVIAFGVEDNSLEQCGCGSGSGLSRAFSVPCAEPGEYTELSFKFGGKDINGGTFFVKCEGEAAVFEASLMDTDNYYGMRKDVIEAMKYIGTSSVRFPGGCAADHLTWRESMKAPEFRIPVSGGDKWFLFPDTYNHDCLDICVNEFMMLAKAIGAEPELTVSFLLSDGSDAYDYVEYVNGGPDTKYGAIRQALGFDAFNVKLWYIGNEVYFFGGQYQRDPVLAAARNDELIAAMRRADDSIIPVVGLTWAESFKQWNHDFVAASKSDYTYVSYHNYIGILPDATQGVNGMATCEMLEGNFADGEDIGLNFYKNELFGSDFDRIQVCADEWNYTWGKDSSNGLFFSNALQFHFLAKSGDKYHVRLADFFMPVNEGMISVKGNDVVLESSAELFRLMAGHKDGVIAACNIVLGCEDLDILCTEHADHLYVSVINRKSAPVSLCFDGYEVKSCVQIKTGEYSFDNNEWERVEGCGVLYGHSAGFYTLTTSN